MILISKKIHPTSVSYCRSGSLLLLSFTASLLLTSCARFRIQELEPGLLFQIPVSLADSQKKNPNLPELQKSGRVYFGLPRRPVITESHIVLADRAKHQIRFYEPGEEAPDLILGKDLKQEGLDDDTELLSVNVGIPGPVAVLPDESLICFVIHEPDAKPKPKYPVGSPEERPITSGSVIRYLPSYVQCLDSDKKPLPPLFADGFNGKQTFKAIERIDLFGEQIFVLHFEKNSRRVWEKKLSLFSKAQETRTIDPLQIEAIKNRASKNSFIEIENIYPEGKSGRIYVYVAYHRKSDFQVQQKALFMLDPPYLNAILLYESDDPADFFACPAPENGFLLQNAHEDGEQVLYKIFSNQGEYLKNVRVTFPELRASTQETWCEADGRIFSSRLFLGKYEVYEWK